MRVLHAGHGDGDGSSNGDEAKARSNPGDKRSTPQAKGEWLDTASLIPREVQAAFPGIRSYLPKDALLTPADIARAKVLGASLSAQDENTIGVVAILGTTFTGEFEPIREIHDRVVTYNAEHGLDIPFVHYTDTAFFFSPSIFTSSLSFSTAGLMV